MIVVIFPPYIFWIMTLHTQLCFCTHTQSFFNREGNIPGATCGIAVDVAVRQLAGIVSGLKSKADSTFLISSRRIVGNHSQEVMSSVLDKVSFSNSTTTTGSDCGRVTSTSNDVQMFLSLNPKIRNFTRDIFQLYAACTRTVD